MLFFAPWVAQRSQCCSIDVNVGLVVLQEIVIFKYIFSPLFCYLKAERRQQACAKLYIFTFFCLVTKLGFSHLKKIECTNKTVLSRIPKSLGRINGRWKDDIKMNSKEIRT